MNYKDVKKMKKIVSNKTGVTEIRLPMLTSPQERVNRVSFGPWLDVGVSPWPNQYRKMSINQTPADTKPMHSAPYRPGPKALEFEKNVSDNMWWERIMEPVETEWVGPDVLLPKKIVYVRFGVCFGIERC